MKKLLFWVIFFAYKIHAMAASALPQDAADRYALIQGLTTAKREQVQRARQAETLVEHPKALVHYILTGEILERKNVDTHLCDAQYMDECNRMRCKLEKSGRTEHTVMKSMAPQAFAEMVYQQLQEYRTKKRRGTKSLKILKEVQLYLQKHS